MLFVTERVLAVALDEDLQPKGRKEVGLTFSRRVLAENCADVRVAFERCVAQIVKETDSLKEDQLARGELVQLQLISAFRKEEGESTRWSVSGRKLISQTSTEELPEYWGEITAAVDFISDTEDYPWMPVKVATSTVPF